MELSSRRSEGGQRHHVQRDRASGTETTRQAAADTMAERMAALYDPNTARFPQGAAVYLGAQVWTVGMEVEGLAQITRGGRTTYVATDQLSPVTAEDEFRGAAFAHLRATGGAR